MNANTRTLIFLVAAMASVGLAAGIHFAHSPASLEDFSDVGELFYPDFKDANTATGLRVASYNKETGQTDVFNVDVKDGLWRIPSHHNYPADAQDRLAKVAASMIGVDRRAMVEKTAAAHKRYDLLDPLDPKVSGTEGRGDRITLTKGDQPVVDFIVGKKVEGKENEYYIRRANEERFYTADLGKLEISTKFGDWIKKDVLEINRNAVTELLINRYYVDEARGRVVSEGTIKLTREAPTGQWEMEGLNPAQEKVKVSEVTAMLNALDDLQIVGVRPKPAALIKGLKGDGEAAIDRFTEMELQEKGFFIGQRGDMVSNEGEVNVGLNDGVIYALGFGEEFSGNEFDIEVGAAKKDEKKEDVADKPADAAKADENAETKPEEPKPGTKNSRYLMVTVHFDKSLLGPEPTQPVKPEPPAEPEKKDAAAEEAKPAATEGQTPETEPKTEPAKPDLKAEYEVALKAYEEELEVYKIKKKDYDEKIRKGQERVSELNRRFADWFYVISEDVFDRLKLKREDLVEKVEAPAAETVQPGGELKINPMSPPAAAPEAAPATPPASAEPATPPAAEGPATPPATPAPMTESAAPPAAEPATPPATPPAEPAPETPPPAQPNEP